MGKKMSSIMKKLRFLKPNEHYSNGWSELSKQDRDWEKLYRRRWQHDKVVRTTHGVNCTGSCSWKVFVKDGIITWETQQTDYPSCGPDMPEFEPRGCSRGASFSWYVYSPLRVKYPYVRGALLNLWREELAKAKNPIEAWKNIVENKEKARTYKEARGKGGLVRGNWEEVADLIAAATLYNIKTYGPDRIAGFTVIPAMSMLSYASGSRFLSLLGSPMLSFYDWYADLPPASPQVWGEQTDSPESSDWYNSSYLMMWGSNVPMTRTPDAHFMTEVRYKGTKVVAICPDYAENVKFADNWLAVKPGSDGALASAMTHVILKEFYVNNSTEYFNNYTKQFTDLPYLITLKKTGNRYVADRFLLASDLGLSLDKSEWKPLVIDEETGKLVVPNGSIGHRWDDQDKGKWNLKMEDQDGNAYNPKMSLLNGHDEILSIDLPYFDDASSNVLSRDIPVKKIETENESVYVTTVFDLMLANYGVARLGLSGYPESYDEIQAYTPAWQEKETGVKKELVIQIAREFAQNAADTNGRSMIIMGCGINHWYNSDAIYRSVMNLLILTGTQGVNGGGWGHYVGQEKLRPLEGWSTIAFARDWSMPRLQNATSFFYFATDQWRYEDLPLGELTSPIVDKPRYQHSADYNALSARLGWMPSYPQFDRNSLSLFDEAYEKGARTDEQVIQYSVDLLKKGEMNFAVEDPDNPVNFPRQMFVWRSNLISSSGKGHEYFLKHLLGASNGLLSEDGTVRPDEVKWREEAGIGKVDLYVSLDFRMAGNALYSDIVLPAASWYEKHDLNSTDMHPFIHPFNPAINPPWEAKSDWDIFKHLSKQFSEMAKKYYSEPKKDLVTTPLLHDSPDEIAQPFGRVRDWKKGEVEPIPGKTMPRMSIIERDYTKIYEKYIGLGTNLETKPIGAHGISYSVANEYEELKKLNGLVQHPGVSKGLPSIETARQASEAVLRLSSSSNGRVAVRAWEQEEKKTGLSLKDLAEERAADIFTFESITVQPKEVIPTPVFTGSNKSGRRYSPFTTNIERLVPFRTLTGRQQFYVDHEIMMEYGEALPVYKPTLPKHVFGQQDNIPDKVEKEITLRYLTPHGKWNIHSMFQDNLFMLTLFRGGPNVWINDKDAAEVGITDNDWLEVYNRNGVVVARAVVSHRMPRGTMYMYHAQDRHINVPGSTITNERGGTHNSPTKIHVKPTQLIGGYAQLSYGFNYYGPIGNQRDVYVSVRKLSKLDWLEE